jgi:hypothetical protein
MQPEVVTGHRQRVSDVLVVTGLFMILNACVQVPAEPGPGPLRAAHIQHPEHGDSRLLPAARELHPAEVPLGRRLLQQPAQRAVGARGNRPAEGAAPQVW